jgi:hypothetical protein
MPAGAAHARSTPPALSAPTGRTVVSGLLISIATPSCSSAWWSARCCSMLVGTARSEERRPLMRKTRTYSQECSGSPCGRARGSCDSSTDHCHASTLQVRCINTICA